MTAPRLQPCGASRDPETYYRDIQAHCADEPLFGPMARNITPCAFWPAAAEPPVQIHNDVPALMVGSTGDPKTPYPGQQAMHRALTGSRLVPPVRDAYRHLVYGPFTVVHDTCVENAINRYLLDGTMPATNTTCAVRSGRA